jgi:hypothetical protein
MFHILNRQTQNLLSRQKTRLNNISSSDTPTILPTKTATVRMTIRYIIVIKILSPNRIMQISQIAFKVTPMLTAKRIRRRVTTNNIIRTQKATPNRKRIILSNPQSLIITKPVSLQKFAVVVWVRTQPKHPPTVVFPSFPNPTKAKLPDIQPSEQHTRQKRGCSFVNRLPQAWTPPKKNNGTINKVKFQTVNEIPTPPTINTTN